MIPTRPVTCIAYDPDTGAKIPNVEYVFELVRLNEGGQPVPSHDLYGLDDGEDGVVASQLVELKADANGELVANLFPNELGELGTQWRVTSINPADGRPILRKRLCTVPDRPCTLKEILDLEPGASNVYVPPVQMQSYAAMQNYTGNRSVIYITQRGIQGLFMLDEDDTTSADNGGTVIVGAGGRRWKRVFKGAASIEWFGAKGDDSTDCSPAIIAAWAAHNHLTAGAGTFILTSKIAIPGYGKLTCSGQGKTLFKSQVVGDSTFYVAAEAAGFIHLSDFTLQGNSVIGALGNGHGINFIDPGIDSGSHTPQFCTLERLYIKGFKGNDKVPGHATNTFEACGIVQADGLQNVYRDVIVQNCGHGYYFHRAQNTKLYNVAADSIMKSALIAYDCENLVCEVFDFVDCADGVPSTHYPEPFGSATVVSYKNENFVLTLGKAKNTNGGMLIRSILSHGDVIEENWLRPDSLVDVVHKGIYIERSKNFHVDKNIFSPATTAFTSRKYQMVEVYNTQIADPVSGTIIGNTFMDVGGMGIEYNVKIGGNATTRTFTNLDVYGNLFGTDQESAATTVDADILIENCVLRNSKIRNAHYAATNVTRASCVNQAASATLVNVEIGPSDFTTNGGTITAPYVNCKERGLVSADRGNASVMLVPGLADEFQLFNTPLPVNRDVTLGTTTATYLGAGFTIMRTAAASGAGKLRVGTLIDLEPDSWCRVVYEAAGWRLVGHGRLSVDQVADYASLRTYIGGAKQVRITGYLGTAAPSGIAGTFVCDDSDTTSADNGGTTLVGTTGVNLGKRWKRVIEDGCINVLWFGAVKGGVTDSAAAIRNALAAHRLLPGSKVILPGIFGIESSIAIQADDVIEGFGRNVSGLIMNGTGSFHGIYGDVVNPAHRAVLRNFTVWAKPETVGTGAFDGIRIHNAQNLLLDNIAAWDGDSVCMRLIDCDKAVIRNPLVGSSTEAKYISHSHWGVWLDGSAHSTIHEGRAERTGMGFAINADDSYRRTYASVTSTANDELTCTDRYFFSNLATGDEVRVFLPDGVGTMPAGITENQVYYAIKSGTDSNRIIKLAATKADALAGTPVIDITSAGSGTTMKSKENLAVFQIDKHPITTSAVFDHTADTIVVDATFYRSHTTGLYPVYLTSDGTLPTGLSANKVYWTHKVTTNTLKLYDTMANALAAGATGLQEFSDNGTGTHTLRLAKISETVTRSGNDITVHHLLYELLRTGDPIHFKADGGAPPAPLVANTTYYVIRTATHGVIQVATSVANARAGTAVVLTDAGSGAQRAVFHSSFGANLSDSLSRRPATAVRGNRGIGCVVERHTHHAFNINSGQNNGFIGCVASDYERFVGGIMAGGTFVNRPSFQAKHSTGEGTDRNFYQGCTALRCASGFFGQGGRALVFDTCTVDEAEHYGFAFNDVDDGIIINPRAARIAGSVVDGQTPGVFWILGSASRCQVHNFNVEAHPNGTSTLFQIDSSGRAVIGAGEHSGAFAYVLDIDAGSGSFQILPGFRTNGLPINIVPTTGSFPLVGRAVVDVASSSIQYLMDAANSMQVAMARITTVEAVSGGGVVSAGWNGDSAKFFNAQAPGAAVGNTVIAMSPAGSTWLTGVSKFIRAHGSGAGAGKVLVEVSGMPV